MSTEPHAIVVSGITIQIFRKDIKNLHLGVYPPNGRVRVAAPLAVSDDAVRLAVIERLGWIKKRQAALAAQQRQSAREMVSGESHYYLGRRYRLHVVESQGSAWVAVRNLNTLELHVRGDADVAARERVLARWYRERLRELAPPLLEKWEANLGVHPTSWGIKKMKTKWGACNADTGRIWLNLELAKKPVQCLEYLIVHELMHLVERRHDDRFVALMDHHLPQWRSIRDELNQAPLGHAEWTY
jgi:predicted metal-dependent hydrolase